MRVREYCEKILFSENLEDKLISVDRWQDHSYKALDPISNPVRSIKIQFSKESKFKKALKEKELETDYGKARLLHFFANHELLALEIMAYTLLRFPETPKAFRRGILQSMKEEQEHLQFYLQGMKKYGMEFGDAPISGFFWDCVKEIRSPIEYTAKMSLCFEQANLDYSLYYQNLFEKMGDRQMAAALHQVYLDEIKHVQIGLHWFDQWRDSSKTQWQAFQDELHFPLSPMRAKGKIFDMASRKKVGFDTDYIENLKLFSASKGHLPTVYWMDVSGERKAIEKNQNQLGFESLMNQDLAFLPSYFAKPFDLCILPQKPSNAFLSSLQAAGFQFPEFAESIKELENRKLKALSPWTWSQHSFEMQNSLQLKKIQSFDTQKLYSKCFSADLCRDFVECHPQYQDILWQPEEEMTYPICVKISHASSGTGVFFFENENEYFAKKKFFDKAQVKGQNILIERKLEKIYDYSYQFYLGDKIKDLGLAHFLIGPNGKYLGARLGKMDSLPEIFFQPLKKKMDRDLKFFVAEKLRDQGYRGYVGIDAMVYKEGSQQKIKPIVEINCRMNMGSLAYFFAKKVHRESYAIWFLKFGDVFEFYEKHKRPLVMQNQLIQEGLLPMMDPQLAKQACGFLYVSRKQDDFFHQLIR